jgi:hypothetical protein
VFPNGLLDHTKGIDGKIALFSRTLWHNLSLNGSGAVRKSLYFKLTHYQSLFFVDTALIEN